MALKEIFGDKVIKGDDAVEVDVSNFAGEDKVIAIYFSAHWCPPCRAFTPQLATWYKNFKKGPNGNNFDIVFVSSDRDEKDFTNYFKEMPWLALPYSERARKDTLSKKFKVSGIPTLVILNAENGQTISGDGRSIIMEDESGAAFPWKPKPFPEIIKGTFVGKGGKELPGDVIEGKVLGLYFSAHWCGPCRAFTPQLIKTYKKLKEEKKNFEIIFISSDHTKESYDQYFDTMPWISIPHADKRKKPLSRLFEVSGIPSLIIVDEEGKTVTTNGRAAVGDNPDGTEFPWYPKPLNKLTGATAAEINEKPSLIWFNGDDTAAFEKAFEMMTPIAVEKIDAWKAAGEDPEMVFFVAGKDDDDDDIVSSLRSFSQLGTRNPLLAIIDVPSQKVYECESDTVDEQVVRDFMKGYFDKTLDGKPLRS